MAPRRQVTFLPKALPAWRRERGMSQAALAKRAGVSEGLIAQIETGKRNPGLGNALQIAEALGVEINAIAHVHVDIPGAAYSVTTHDEMAAIEAA